MCPLFGPVPNKTNELTVKAINTMLKRDLFIRLSSSKSFCRLFVSFSSFVCLGYFYAIAHLRLIMLQGARLIKKLQMSSESGCQKLAVQFLKGICKEAYFCLADAPSKSELTRKTMADGLSDGVKLALSTNRFRKKGS
jgi:hypothetical protein